MCYLHSPGGAFQGPFYTPSDQLAEQVRPTRTDFEASLINK